MPNLDPLKQASKPRRYGVAHAALAGVIIAIGFTQLAGPRIAVIANVIIFALLIWWTGRAIERLERESRRTAQAAAVLAAIVESSDEAIIGNTLDGTITSWNRGAERLYGYTAAEAVGRSISFLFPADRADELARLQERVRQGERIEQLETVRLTKNGTPVSVSMTVSPIRDDTGSLVGASAISHDVTERLLTQAKTQEAAQRSEFTSMISHHLRTPLTVIKGSLDILLRGNDGALNAEQHRHLSIAKRNVDRLARLINDVLDYQRLEAGRMELQMVPLDLNELACEIARRFTAEANKKALALSAQLDPDVPPIIGDREKLTQVLTNLLSNALKFTERGEVRVLTERGDNCVRLSVRDDGPSIKAEDLGKLFDRATGSPGLELAISKKIIEAHGGRMGVESVPGRGSIFYAILPVTDRRGQ